MLYIYQQQQQLCQLGTHTHTHAYRYEKRERDTWREGRAAQKLHKVAIGSLSFSFAFSFFFSVHLARATLGVNICIESILLFQLIVPICQAVLANATNMHRALESMQYKLNSKLVLRYFFQYLQLCLCSIFYFSFLRCIKYKSINLAISLVFKYLNFNDHKLKAILNSVKSPPHIL